MTVVCRGVFLRFILLILVASPTGILMAQTEFVVVDSLHITGLKKTKHEVILREIDLHSGDTIGLDQLAIRMGANEKRILATGLFTLAVINVRNWNTDLATCDISIDVHENWFLYPYIIFELADRNFNVWAREQNYSLKRVNYGVALNHINFTGMKDKLKLKFQQGFTHKYEVTYEYPYLKNGWGFSANYIYTQNREIPFIVRDNKPVFVRLDDERNLFRSHRASVSMLRRSSPWMFQKVTLEYSSARVDTAIATRYNKQYFGESRSGLRYFAIDYLARYDRTIYPLYPLGGYRLEANIRKEGIGWLSDTDNLWISLVAEKHIPFAGRLYFSTRLKAKKNLQNNPLPYYLNNGIGYRDDNMIGYQLYTLDGRDFVLANTALKCRLTDRNFRTFDWFPRPYRTMNVKLFARFSIDYGYSRDPVFGNINPLSNSHQYGFGPGLDAILFNILSITGEWGVTRFGEKAFFFKADFIF